MSYWSKQKIAGEVELEKMRRAKPKVTQSERIVAAKAQKEVPSQSLPNYLQRLIPKEIKAAKPAQVVS